MLGPTLRAAFAPMFAAIFGAMLRPALAVRAFGTVFLARFLVGLARNRLLDGGLVTGFAMLTGLAMLARFLGLATWTAAALATAARATTAPATAPTPATAVAGFQRHGLDAGHVDAGDGGADKLLDRLDQAAVGRRRQGERMTGLAGTASAADAMHVVLRRERHVEIEHV